MHLRDGKPRRAMALHNAELAGQERARAGGTEQDNPYSGKKLRGATVGLYWAWRRGFEQQKRDDALTGAGK